ncbi:hypothetical protein ACFLRZ_04065 [Bacteroidota bacterium]
MDLDNLQLVVVGCLGHSGSRLLVNILEDNGIYMGRYRSTIGEDEVIWSKLLADPSLNEAYIKFINGVDKTSIKELLKKTFSQYQSSILNKPGFLTNLKVHFRQRYTNSTTYIKNPPSELLGYGFKNATGSLLIIEAFFELLNELQLEQNTCFIHLSRELGNWLESGYKKGTRGVPRYIYSPRGNFKDEAIRYLWFNSTNEIIKKNDGKEWNIAEASITEIEENREFIESLLWANSNKRMLEIGKKASHFLHLRYNEILLNPENTAETLSTFFNRKFTINRKLDKTRITEYKPEIIPELAKEISEKLGYKLE